MALKRMHCLVVLAMMGLASAAAGESDTAPFAGAAALVSGMETVTIDGVPGTLHLWGPHVASLFRDRAGKDTAALLDDGKRRAVVLTHDAWFKASTWKDTAAGPFLDRALAWLTKGKKGARVLCFQSVDMASSLRARGHVVDEPARFPTVLEGYDLVVIHFPRSLDKAFGRESAQALAAAFASGTSLLGAGIGWVFEGYGDGARGADIAVDYSANIILAGYGIEYTGGSGGATMRAVKPGPGSQTVRTTAGALMAAAGFGGSTGLAADKATGVAADKEGPRDRSFLEVSERVLRPLRDWKELLGPAAYGDLLAWLALEGARLVPTDRQPLPAEDTRKRAMVVLCDLIMQRHPEDFGWLQPALGDFPGRAGPGEVKGVAAATVLDPALPRWQSLGAWADPGAEVTCTIEGLAPGESLELRVGAHTDVLHGTGHEAWERWPFLSRTWKVREGRQTMQSPYGGPLYMEIPDGLRNTWAKDGTARVVKVSMGGRGTRAMAVYRPGMAQDDFLGMAVDFGAPWVEIGGNHVVFTVPVTALPPGFEAGKLMEFWDRAAILVPELLGVPPTPHPQRFVADRQISAGYMHSGYPVMTHLDVASYQLGGTSETAEWKGLELFGNGAWGHFHELGHNYQQAAWTPAGAGEVTVNLFTLYVMDRLLGIRPVEHRYLLRHREAVKAYLQKPRWSLWASNPFVGLHTYAYLIDGLGWEPLKKTLAAYQSMKKEDLPVTEQDKVDRWVVLMSRNSGKNLVPYFRRWAWPVGKAAEKSVKHLPEWKWKGP